MSIIAKLATSLNRRDEVPNQELAAELVKSRDAGAIAELAENLTNKTSGIRHDCIKALYEIGHAEPSLIAPFLGIFLDLLSSKDNRMQWGAMTAIAFVAKAEPKSVFKSLPAVLTAADKGSVITRDNCVRILITLYPGFATKVFPLMIEQLMASPTNQLPMYAEEMLPALNVADKGRFAEVLASRLGDIEKDSKRKRVEKVIQKALR